MQPHRKRVSDKLWDFGNRLDDCEREIADNNTSINQLYNPLKATDYSGMPSGGGISDTTLETVAMIENYHKEVNNLVKLKEHIKAEFETYIEPLKHQHKEVIRLRYIEGLSPLKISFKTSYSEIHVKRLLGQSQDFLERQKDDTL